MLRWRLLFGTIFIAALVALFWIDLRVAPSGLVLFVLALLLAPLAADEMVRLLTVREQRPVAWVMKFGTFLVVLCGGIPHFWPNYPPDCPLGTLGWPLLGLAACLLLAVVAEMLRYETAEGVVKNMALAIFAIVYVGLMLNFMVQLRFAGGAKWTAIPLVSLLACVKLCDVGAYTMGRLFGRHKLAPRISPGKTIEGVLGGLVFAAVGGWLVISVLAPYMAGADAGPIPVWAALLYGATLGAAGIIGDLAESMLKRDAGFKDSSAWMPGFGGLLDLLDSLLAAAPVAYVFWVLV